MEDLQATLGNMQDWLNKHGYSQNMRIHIKAYLQVTNIKPTKIGWNSVRDTGLAKRILEGTGSCSLNTADAVLFYMYRTLTPVQLEMFKQLIEKEKKDGTT